MTALQKQFKILSLVLALAGVVGLVGGVLALLGSGASGAFFVGLGASAPAQALFMIGVAAVVAGACCLVAGLVGALAANRPRDVRRARSTGLLAAAVAVLAVVVAGMGRCVAWVPALSVVLCAAVLVWAARANREALDR